MFQCTDGEVFIRKVVSPAKLSSFSTLLKPSNSFVSNTIQQCNHSHKTPTKWWWCREKSLSWEKMRRKRENQSIHASVPYPNMAREKPLIKSTINLLWAYMIHSQNTHNQLQRERERRREKRQFEKASKSKQTQCKDENISYLRPETRHRSSCRTS